MPEVETRASTGQPKPDAIGNADTGDAPRVGVAWTPNDTSAGFLFPDIMAGQVPELPPGQKPGTFDPYRVAGLTCPEAPNQSPARFDSLISQIDATDAAQGIGHVRTVFFGSSTIANWTDLQKTFADMGAINRGIGGSTLPDLNYAVEDLVLKHTPDRVVLYAGTNDLAGGNDPDMVLDNLKTLEQAIHGTSPTGPKLPGASPDIKLYVVGMIPAPCREVLDDQYHLYREGNDLIKDYTTRTPNTFFIDPSAAVDDRSGNLDPTRFGPDQLHPKPEVYGDLAGIIRRDIAEDEVAAP